MPKPLSTYSTTFLIVASMLGTGILTTTGIILALVKSPTAVLCIWIAGGGLAWIGAWCYGELARIMPRNGGEATILRELFSSPLGEIAGLTSFVVGFAACNAASSLTLADYLGEALPGLPLAAKVVACLALLAVTSLHGYFGPLGLRIQTLLATSKFCLLAGLALYGLFLAAPTEVTKLVTATPAPAVAFNLGTASAWGLSMMLVMFAYSGWNAAIYVAGEVRDPERNVRRAMIYGTTIIVVLYVAINAVLLTRLPTQELEGVRPVIAALTKHLFGPGASSIFSGFVAFAMLSSLGVSAFLGPRVLAAMLGWFKKPESADTSNASTEPVPVAVTPRLVWLQAGLSIFMVLTGSFVQILTVTGFLLGLFPILCVLGLYRQACTRQGRPLKLTRYLLAPLFVGFSALILLLGATQSPDEVGISLSLLGLFLLARLGLRRFA